MTDSAPILVLDGTSLVYYKEGELDPAQATEGSVHLSGEIRELGKIELTGASLVDRGGSFDITTAGKNGRKFHLQLAAEGYHGYWSSGGTEKGGWSTDEEVRAVVGADGECDGQRDRVLGWFHVGVCDTQTGICSEPKKPLGTPCDDRDPATGNDFNVICGWDR